MKNSWLLSVAFESSAVCFLDIRALDSIHLWIVFSNLSRWNKRRKQYETELETFRTVQLLSFCIHRVFCFYSSWAERRFIVKKKKSGWNEKGKDSLRMQSTTHNKANNNSLLICFQGPSSDSNNRQARGGISPSAKWVERGKFLAIQLPFIFQMSIDCPVTDRLFKFSKSSVRVPFWLFRLFLKRLKSTVFLFLYCTDFKSQKPPKKEEEEE